MEKELHHMKVAADNTKTAKDKVEKDMNLFAVDQLGPTQKALEEAEENEKRCKAAMKMTEQAFTKEWEEMKKRFDEHKNNGMTEVTNKFNDARDNVDDKTMEANEKADKAEKYKKEFDKLTHQFENAKEDQMKALEDASTFDFVGGGATNIAKHQ